MTTTWDETYLCSHGNNNYIHWYHLKAHSRALPRRLNKRREIFRHQFKLLFNRPWTPKTIFVSKRAPLIRENSIFPSSSLLPSIIESDVEKSSWQWLNRRKKINWFRYIIYLHPSTSPFNDLMVNILTLTLNISSISRWVSVFFFFASSLLANTASLA